MECGYCRSSVSNFFNRSLLQYFLLLDYILPHGQNAWDRWTGPQHCCKHEQWRQNSPKIINIWEVSVLRTPLLSEISRNEYEWINLRLNCSAAKSIQKHKQNNWTQETRGSDSTWEISGSDPGGGSIRMRIWRGWDPGIPMAAREEKPGILLDKNGSNDLIHSNPFFPNTKFSISFFFLWLWMSEASPCPSRSGKTCLKYPRSIPNTVNRMQGVFFKEMYVLSLNLGWKLKLRCHFASSFFHFEGHFLPSPSSSAFARYLWQKLDARMVFPWRMLVHWRLVAREGGDRFYVWDASCQAARLNSGVNCPQNQRKSKCGNETKRIGDLYVFFVEVLLWETFLKTY